MVELVTVIVIAGVIGAVIAPRFFSRNTFDDSGFVDTTLAALHYAQKSAIAQRRTVCVAFVANPLPAPVNSVSLTISSTFGGACDTNLVGPAGENPYQVTARGQSSYAAVPANFNFTPQGGTTLPQPPQQHTINVVGTSRAITIDAVTGYAF